MTQDQKVQRPHDGDFCPITCDCKTVVVAVVGLHLVPTVVLTESSLHVIGVRLFICVFVEFVVLFRLHSMCRVDLAHSY